ncbi:hypothetical protein [Kocuria massiliensis]|uniref:hypothetical protein n=1 Tax=Kocuria massiliensis TaxID=1926282 RepID=UPI0022B9D1FF|nr:hypothetical protein [Kocuria massiliensis]
MECSPTLGLFYARKQEEVTKYKNQGDRPASRVSNTEQAVQILKRQIQQKDAEIAKLTDKLSSRKLLLTRARRRASRYKEAYEEVTREKNLLKKDLIRHNEVEVMSFMAQKERNELDEQIRILKERENAYQRRIAGLLSEVEMERNLNQMRRAA